MGARLQAVCSIAWAPGHGMKQMSLLAACLAVQLHPPACWLLWTVQPADWQCSLLAASLAVQQHPPACWLL